MKKATQFIVLYVLQFGWCKTFYLTYMELVINPILGAINLYFLQFVC